VKPEKLRSSYRSALTTATTLGLRSVALCCISTGIYGYPLQQATPVALSAVREWLGEGKNSEKLDAVIFCVFQDKELEIYRKWLPVFFPPVVGNSPFPKLESRVPDVPTLGMTVSKLTAVGIDQDDDDDDDDPISTKIDHTKEGGDDDFDTGRRGGRRDYDDMGGSRRRPGGEPPSYNDSTRW